MNQTDLNDLSIGDIIRHKNMDTTWIVMGNYGGRAAARTIDITNLNEWELVKTAKYEDPQ